MSAASTNKRKIGKLVNHAERSQNHEKKLSELLSTLFSMANNSNSVSKSRKADGDVIIVRNGFGANMEKYVRNCGLEVEIDKSDEFVQLYVPANGSLRPEKRSSFWNVFLSTVLLICICYYLYFSWKKGFKLWLPYIKN